MYRNRIIEAAIKNVADSFPCIVIYGSRQVGKSTTVNYIFGKKIRRITLDDGDRRMAAKSNPRLFLETYGWPLIIDEIQKVPELHYDRLAGDIGIDVRTCKRWISILETAGIIYLLHPYMHNISNRIIKAPKLYFMDTGLCAYLCK